ncbi:asparagine synthase-related protein, partial [Salmonella enterica]|uniref:asparagine synthase-related protein n=1 Tax=Salmonella enterica TaxID=28901 RepID=UPI0020A56B12
MNCVSAQLADAQHPLLQLSGGLDSSILAAVLHEMGTPFRAVTLATRDAEGDERRFARAVAGHLGIPLEE